ncbi:unnamed protein product [Zymoseptoria tritici ST99CH_3D1]|uniref:Uncharacterized protein n=1 Tax=Zymoseptoria tritici ST99CH_1E4 TaxID=1276532 RepID=A0A2H1H9N2_ZYMTR|nr:unnamed protein product [Zymoseptoria tritici ST99CH_1E4]SMR65026.1 unnamed protein product [Zymoseptoria tritici ST99CH_3D1]
MQGAAKLSTLQIISPAENPRNAKRTMPPKPDIPALLKSLDAVTASSHRADVDAQHARALAAEAVKDAFRAAEDAREARTLAGAAFVVAVVVGVLVVVGVGGAVWLCV